MNVREQLNTLTVGDKVVVQYDHPHKPVPQTYNGEVETNAATFIRLKREDGSYRSFSKFLIRDFVRLD